MDFFAALHALSSFDHGACNRILFDRHITLPVSRYRNGGYGAYEPDPAVDLGLPLLFLVPVVWLTVWSYVRRETYRGKLRNYYYYAGPVIALFVLFILSLGVRGIMDYAATCTALLRVAS
jgi:hypothetical protein